jgi:hypothetical protein
MQSRAGGQRVPGPGSEAPRRSQGVPSAITSFVATGLKVFAGPLTGYWVRPDEGGAPKGRAGRPD